VDALEAFSSGSVTVCDGIWVDVVVAFTRTALATPSSDFAGGAVAQITMKSILNKKS
jgi:hypothetical protein